MKREYSSDDFRRIVDYLREKYDINVPVNITQKKLNKFKLLFRVPGVNILTDVICGFPTETDEDFQMTVDLVNKYRFSSLFINQFFQRPGTPAAKMRQIQTQEVFNNSNLKLSLISSVIFLNEFRKNEELE